MTRCKAFYRKMKKLRGDSESALKFCQKEDRTVRGIYNHIDFMDKHFPHWLNDETESADKSSSCTIVPNPQNVLSEGTTRGLRKLQRKEPDVLEKVVEELSQSNKSPTVNEVQHLVLDKRNEVRLEKKIANEPDRERERNENCHRQIKDILSRLDGLKNFIRNNIEEIRSIVASTYTDESEIDDSVDFFCLRAINDDGTITCCFSSGTREEYDIEKSTLPYYMASDLFNALYSLYKKVYSMTPEGKAAKLDLERKRIASSYQSLKYWIWLFGQQMREIRIYTPQSDEDKQFCNNGRVADIIRELDAVREIAINEAKEYEKRDNEIRLDKQLLEVDLKC